MRAKSRRYGAQMSVGRLVRWCCAVALAGGCGADGGERLEVIADAVGDGRDSVDTTPEDPDTPDAGDADEGDVETAIEPDSADTADTTDTGADSADGGLATFSRERVPRVELTLPPADWDTLRGQRRSLFALLGEGCMSGPAADVFSWFEADLSIDEVALPRIGLRKKGFLGSLDSERPSLRLELDEFVAGQRHEGLERLTLNNGKQDPSRLRQCVTYDLFRAAGVAAPRCAFAHVFVNRVDLGLYVHVEAIKKPFLREWFARGDGLDPADGALWEGQLSDFREGWLDTFEPKLDRMTPDDSALLTRVVDALELDDAALIAGLEAVIDLDQFLSFWAVESLTSHWDGYAGNTNNFFVYAPPGDDRRLRFVPWGVDQTFGDPRAFGGSPATFATGALAHRLYAHPEGRSRFEARLGEVLARFDEDELLTELGRWATLVRPHREPGSREAGDADVAALMTAIEVRRDDITGALTDPPDGFPPPLRDALCLRERGEVVGTFTTTWGTLGVDNLFLTGTGTLSVTSDALPPLAFGLVGAKSGYSAESQSGQLVIGAQVLQAGFIVVVIDVPPYPAVGEAALGVFPQGVVFYVEPGGAPTLLGLLSGRLVLDEVDATPGAPVKGRLNASLWMFPGPPAR